jgi:hypothetical protein
MTTRLLVHSSEFWSSALQRQAVRNAQLIDRSICWIWFFFPLVCLPEIFVAKKACSDSPEEGCNLSARCKPCSAECRGRRRGCTSFALATVRKAAAGFHARWPWLGRAACWHWKGMEKDWQRKRDMMRSSLLGRVVEQQDGRVFVYCAVVSVHQLLDCSLSSSSCAQTRTKGEAVEQRWPTRVMIIMP